MWLAMQERGGCTARKLAPFFQALDRSSRGCEEASEEAGAMAARAGAGAGAAMTGVEKAVMCGGGLAGCVEVRHPAVEGCATWDPDYPIRLFRALAV